MHNFVLGGRQDLTGMLEQRATVSADHERKEHGLKRQNTGFDCGALALNPVS
jgi:hypothetical protein